MLLNNFNYTKNKIFNNNCNKNNDNIKNKTINKKFEIEKKLVANNLKCFE